MMIEKRLAVENILPGLRTDERASKNVNVLDEAAIYVRRSDILGFDLVERLAMDL